MVHKGMGRAFRNRWRGLLSEGVRLIQDNVAEATQEMFDSFGWEIFDHLPILHTVSTFHLVITIFCQS